MTTRAYGSVTQQILAETVKGFESINNSLKSKRLEMRFNNRRKKPVLCEHFSKYGMDFMREIWEYENPDGSIYPVCIGVLDKFITEANTSYNPVVDRVKDYVREQEAICEAAEAAPAQAVQDMIEDDIDRITNTPKHFMGPSMVERRQKPAPYQKRALDAAGEYII